MNRRLIRALRDARGALYAVEGIQIAGIRGDASLTEEVIEISTSSMY